MSSIAATTPSDAKPKTDRCRMLSILLPVRNEGINLRIMLKILRAVVDVPHEVLVVYDSAGDDSVVVVNDVRQIYPELRGVQNTLGNGVVNAIRAGVAASEGDVILIFAADEVGPVLAIEDMITLIREGCDFVSCTRYAHGGRRLGGSPVGAFLSFSANWLFHRVAPSPVTGATGFIGSALVRALLKSGNDVRALDNESRGSRHRLSDVESQIERVHADVRDPAAVARAVQGMDTVCHLAAVNGTEFFYTQPDLVLEVAVKGMLNVLDACVAHGVGNLFVASSSEVYQTPAQVPTDETVALSIPDPLNPRYSYAGGKIII